jgi:hypothetical protein
VIQAHQQGDDKTGRHHGNRSDQLIADHSQQPVGSRFTRIDLASISGFDL